MRAPTGRVDHGGAILDLALYRVRFGVATVASPAASICDHGECVRQMFSQRETLGAVIQATADEYQHRAFIAEPVVPDAGAVGRCRIWHGPLLHSLTPTLGVAGVG